MGESAKAVQALLWAGYIIKNIQARRDLERSLVQPLPRAGAALKSNLIAQSFVQSGLKNPQEWKTHQRETNGLELLMLLKELYSKQQEYR